MPKILIIEDDKFLRELISRKLKSEGYEAIEAIDGESGLKKIKEEKPDLVVLDLLLPGMHGFEVLTFLKEEPSLAALPVLILSNLGQRDEVEKGLELGAMDYLIKPHFTPSEVVEKMRKMLTLKD